MVDKMVNIECLVCRKAVKIPKDTDTEQYDGQMVCQQCQSLLDVKLVKSKVQKRKIVVDKSNQKDRTTHIYIAGGDDAKQRLERLMAGEVPKAIEQEPEEREGNTQ